MVGMEMNGRHMISANCRKEIILRDLFSTMSLCRHAVS
jgi:hypothetical protein